MRPLVPCTLVLALASGAFACGGGLDASSPNRSPVAEKWFSRAKQSYRSGDTEDAAQAIDGALKAAPRDVETRLLAARIALAKLDYAETVRLTEGMAESEAKGLRGRALWYAGDIERAADELEDMLRDPSIKDNWARDVARLARRGQGRHPFAIEGGFVAAVEMPQAGPAQIVPCELDGERILALVATNFGELMIDSASRKEPAWVNLRFGERLEVKDVPALTHDLSGVSRQLGAPIKALIGVNALRHMHATFDRRGSQFVVRKNEAPAPPDATRMPVFYARGGAMMMRGAVSTKDEGQTLFFVDSSAFYPIALDDGMLKQSGANLKEFRTEPGAPAGWKAGTIPYFKLGTIDLPQIPAMQGANVGEYKQTFDVDVGGVLGAGLLQVFRVTFGEDGRAVWLELDPGMVGAPEGRAPERATQPSPPPDNRPAPGPVTAPKVEPPKSSPALERPAPAPVPGAKTERKSESKGAAR